jgi:hypothetical protein
MEERLCRIGSVNGFAPNCWLPFFSTADPILAMRLSYKIDIDMKRREEKRNFDAKMNLSSMYE